MADNNLDIRARLTAEDNASATVTKLMAKIKSLEAQLKALGKARNPISTIPYEDFVKGINRANRSLDGLTKKHIDWAKAQKANNELNQLGWTKLTNQIQQAAKAYDTATGKKKQSLERELRMHYKNAVAFRYLYNRGGQERMDIQRRVTEQLGNLEAAHLRNVERSHRTHVNNLARIRRDGMRSMSTMAGFGSRAGMYAAAGAAATGYAGQSAFRTRMKVDTAETNLSMFGGLSKSEIQAQRKEWLNQSAIKFGAAPDAMIDAFTETLKAGVPRDKARQVTDTIMQSATGLDLDLKNTTKFATRVATLTGDMSNLDPAKIKSILNAVAVVNRESAADSNEIIAANRRASGVFSMSKMTPEQLSAFTSAGISAEMPSGKTGTFLGFMVSELVGAKNARGQRAKDIGSAANALGFGGRQGLSSRMAANPSETLMSIFDKMGNMGELQRAKVANQLGMREWRDELGTFIQVRDDVARLLKAIDDPKNKGMLDDTIEKKLNSLAGRWNSLVSAFKLLWESVGAGLEKVFGEISAFFTDYMGRIDTSKISKTVEAFTDGIVAGLGFDSWSDMLKAAFGNPDDVKEYSRQIFGFVKGFMSGMKEMFTAISTIFSGLMKAAGLDVNDPESIGKFTARLVEFGVALKGVGMLGEALAAIVTFVKGLTIAAAAFLGLPGMAALLSGLALKNQDQGVGDANVKRPGETTNEWRERQRKARDKLYKPSSYSGSTDFSGMRRSKVDDLASQLSKFGGNVERAAFISGGPGGGMQYVAMSSGGSARGSLGGSGGSSGGRSFIGGVPDLLKSVPGQALPNIMGSNGIIRRDKIPLFSGTGGSASIVNPNNIPSFGGGGGTAANPGSSPGDGVGAGLFGNSFLAARRGRFAEEMKNDPNLRLHLAAMQMTEGVSKGGTIESLMNRMDMQGSSLRKGLGYSADGAINPRSFYGPIRRGELGPAIAKLRANPKLFEKYDAYTQRALAGSHAIGGYTDQGLPTDPNGSARTGIPGLRLRGSNGKLDGNEFTDWVGPGSSWGRGRGGAMNYRKFIEQGIAGSGPPPGVTSAVPTPSEAIQNVPPAIRGDASLGLNGGGRGGGPVAIHINGNSHDPEALATLVQRRVDESMNWRTHDTASEYT